jgi:uncharacterized protein (DUF983 family)
MHEAPTLATTLARVARLACPACGKGPVFARFFVRAECCERCRWRFERGDGHWVGGSEVHMFASYLLSVLVCFPVLLVAGPTPLAMVLVIAGHVAVSLAVFRWSRSLFLGLDYYFDPAAPPREDDRDEGERSPASPRTPPSVHRRRALFRERASGRPAGPTVPA